MKKVLHFCVQNTANFGDDAIIHQIRKNLTDNVKDVEIITKELSFLAHGGIFEFLKLIRGTDLVIIGGGGIISRFFWPLRNVFLKLLKLLSIPIYFYGVGIGLRLGETIDSLPVESLQLWLKYAKKVAVRDYETLTAFQQIGIKDCIMFGDPVLSCTKKLIPLKRRDKVIGVNIANHGWKDEAVIMEQVVSPLIIQLSKLQKAGYSFRYIAHHKAESVIFERLAQSLDIEYCSLNMGNVSDTYQGLCFHIGMMLHSTIFALTNNTPFINLLYDEKNKAFLELFDIQSSGLIISDIPKTSFDELVKRISNSWLLQQQAIFEQRMELIEQQVAFVKLFEK